MTIADAAVGAGSLDAAPQLALGDVLQVLVDRQLERRAGGRRPLDAAERVARGVGLDRAPCPRGRGSACRRSPRCRRGRVVDADVAEHVRGELPVRVEAPALLHEADAFELQVGDTRAPVPASPAGGRRRTRVPLRMRSTSACRSSASQSSSAPHSDAARLLGVADLGRHRVDRVRVHAVGEHVAVAIEDLAALGRRVDRPQLLALGARRRARRGGRPAGRPAAPRWRPTRAEKTDGGNDEPALQRRAPGVGGLVVGHAKLRLFDLAPATTDCGGGGVGCTRSITDRVARRRARPSAAVRWRAARCAPASAASRSRDAGAG